MFQSMSVIIGYFLQILKTKVKCYYYYFGDLSNITKFIYYYNKTVILIFHTIRMISCSIFGDFFGILGLTVQQSVYIT